MSKIKLGIIGCGNMGISHVKNILKGKCPEVELVAVADIKAERLDVCRALCDKWNSEHPEKPACQPLAFENGEKMMDAKVVDAVLVAVPHYDHPRLVIAALERGIHALSEKPAGVYTLQVREMIACADRHPELVFGMMFNQRTNPVYRKMREIIQSGELGEIRRINWIITNWYRPQCYYDSGEWRATWRGEGGGVLLNQCPHNLDLWQWICGMPKRIQAHLHYGKWHDIEVEDDVSAYVEYENGATGIFVTTTGEAPGVNRFEVICDGGSLLCEDAKCLTVKKLSMFESEYTKLNRTKAYTGPEVAVITPELEGENSQHVGVLNAFAAAILRGEPLIADGREGINGLLISNAMHLSSWENRMVELPFDEQHFYDLLMEKVKTSRRKVNANSVLSDTEGSYNS